MSSKAKEITKGNIEMASNDVVVNEEIYNKEYRRLRTLTSQTDIVKGSVSFDFCRGVVARL